jgi:Asp-tRNA(Asn)/Glu-tRNA(Gln) amidotransferase A subunit family amidase
MTDSIQNPDEDYTKCTVMDLSELYRSKKVKPTQVLEQYIARIIQLNGPFHQYTEEAIGYNAIVQLFEDDARIEARNADARFEQWTPGTEPPPPVLCGVPIAIKENIEVRGRECVVAAPDLFAGNVAASDATVVEKLHEQGAVIVGYAIASRLTENTQGMFAGNAWDVARSPGGSSQGSGVAPIIRFCVAALGGETGGSITKPASANGTSAIKPSSGLISVAGVMPMQPGIDVVGPMARSMQDAAVLMNAVMGVDSKDPQTLEDPTPPSKMPTLPRIGRQPLKGLKIGVPQQDWMINQKGTPPYDAYIPDYQTAFTQLTNDLVSLGAEVTTAFNGLDIDNEDENPFFNYKSLGTFEIDFPIYGGPIPMPIMAEQAVCFPNWIEWGWIAKIKEFAETIEDDERKTHLLRVMTGIQEPIAKYLIDNPELRSEGQERLRRLRANYSAALAAENIDFMLFLELGAYPRSKYTPTGLDLPIYREHFALENAMGWPVVTFPIGHGMATGLEPTEMPISASFWGPRFSDAILVQVVLDYQDRFNYHTKIPKEMSK